MKLSAPTSIFLFGISSGLPFSITGSLLHAWAASTGVSLTEIGLYGLFALPYALKFLWAPLLDLSPGFVPRCGRRRSVIFLTQLLLFPIIAALAFLPPGEQPYLLAVVALLLALLSATQDIAIDGYRAEILPSVELGRSASLGVLGYRLGSLLSGAGALVLVSLIGFQFTILLLGVVLAGLIPVTLLAPDPDSDLKLSSGGYLDGFLELVQRERVGEILLIAVLYRAGDMLLSAMTIPFLVQRGFSLATIGTVQNGFGIVAVMLGTAIAGVILPRISLRQGLLWFGILQGLSSLSYLALLYLATPLALAGIVFVENVSAGLGTAAFLAYLMSVSRGPFTGTQYAILTSLMALTRVAISIGAGALADFTGWEIFIGVSAVLGLLGAGTPFLLTSVPETEVAKGEGNLH